MPTWPLLSDAVPHGLLALAVLVVSYLCGSIPFGVLIARWKGLDIQRTGSGNIGATNVGRALGFRYFLLVFALDFFKGFLPTLAATLIGRRQSSTPFLHDDLPVLCALAAVLGHVFSVWLKFRGGKAGATGLGVGAVICWPAMIAAAVVWLACVAITRYVSLSTILGSGAYVLAYLAIVVVVERADPIDRAHATRTIFCTAVAVLVVVRHKDNIRRLIAGTESKIGVAGAEALGSPGRVIADSATATRPKTKS